MEFLNWDCKWKKGKDLIWKLWRDELEVREHIAGDGMQCWTGACIYHQHSHKHHHHHCHQRAWDYLKRRGDFQQISCRLKTSSLGSQFIKFKGDHQFYPLSYWGNPYIHIALTSPLISSPGVKKFCCRRFFGGTRVCSPNASHFWHILMLKPPRFVFENIRFQRFFAGTRVCSTSSSQDASGAGKTSRWGLF